MSSTRIENVNFDVKELTNKDLFFDTLTISNRRIHLLHNLFFHINLPKRHLYSTKKDLLMKQKKKAGNPAYLYNISFAVCVIKSNNLITSDCLS